MLLRDFLDATIGPHGATAPTIPWHEIAPMLAGWSQAERDELLVSFDRDQAAEFASMRRRLRATHTASVALATLCARQTPWTAELATHAFRACWQLESYGPLGGEQTLAAMARDGVSLAGTPAEAEFERLVAAYGEIAEEARARRIAFALFGKPYVPRIETSHGALTDDGFGRYLARLIDLGAVDEAWWMRHAAAYRAWEAAFGDRRWIEHVPPPLPPELPPPLAALLARATAKPSARWLADVEAIVAARPEAARAGVVAMLHRVGSAADVAASDVAWRAAQPFAWLHLTCREWRLGVRPSARTRLPDGTDANRIGTGLKRLPMDGPRDPMTLSRENVAFARGLATVAARWRDGETIAALASAATGAEAVIAHAWPGPLMRSPAVFATCVRALAAIGGDEATAALSALRAHATDPRARRVLAEAV